MMLAVRAPQSHPAMIAFSILRASIKAIISRGANTSFASLKQIEAGALNVGYAETGPTNGPPVFLPHGRPYDICYVDVAPLLASAGYRAIVPYLRGYRTTRFLSSATFGTVSRRLSPSLGFGQICPLRLAGLSVRRPDRSKQGGGIVRASVLIVGPPCRQPTKTTAPPTREILIHPLRELLLLLCIPNTTFSLEERKHNEMIMSYAAHSRDFGSVANRTPGDGAAVAKRPGILRRIFDALLESRQRDTDRQIASFLAARSSRSLTDDLEREISRRLSTSNWSLNVSPYDDRRFP